MSADDFPNLVQIDENPWSFLRQEWARRTEVDPMPLVPDRSIECHILLGTLNGMQYVRFSSWTYTFDFDDMSLSIPASSPWFCLNLAYLIPEYRYEEAEDRGFMLCPECGSQDFTHLKGQNWFEDECIYCDESWHAIGYSWINELVGVWMLDYGDYLAD